MFVFHRTLFGPICALVICIILILMTPPYVGGNQDLCLDCNTKLFGSTLELVSRNFKFNLYPVVLSLTLFHTSGVTY